MDYRVIAGTECNDRTCPTVYEADELGGDVLVQGFVVDPAEAAKLRIPAGEAVVRVPRTLLHTVPRA